MKVLAVGAHPLDTVFLAGGVLARYAGEGHSVAVAIMCSPGPESLGPGETVQKREEEVARAAALIGVEPCFLRLEAGALVSGEEARLRLGEVMCRVSPRVVLTHAPEDYCLDHVRTSELVLGCHFLAGREIESEDLPPVVVPPDIFYMDTVSGIGFEPEQFVDITSVFETKKQMMACFEGEIAAWQDDPVLAWMEWMTVHSRYRGIQAGVGYAEAFRRPARWGHMTPTRLLP